MILADWCLKKKLFVHALPFKSEALTFESAFMMFALHRD